MPILFLDFEASSLGPDSYPIEIGWAEESGKTTSRLIRPPAGWTDWNSEAEKVHGIARSTLLAEGVDVREVAEEAWRVLAAPGVTVHSDAPEWDEAWLATLLFAGGIRTRIPVRDVLEACAVACRPLLALSGNPSPEYGNDPRKAAMAILARSEEAEERRGPRRHRAAEDALSMQRVWAGVRDRVWEATRHVGLPGQKPQSGGAVG
jgi:hypothetical protein